MASDLMAQKMASESRTKKKKMFLFCIIYFTIGKVQREGKQHGKDMGSRSKE